MIAVEKLKIIQDTPGKYHFKTKDDQRVEIEHKNERLFISLFKWGTETSLLIDLSAVSSTQHRFLETENCIELENPDFLLRVYPIDTRSTGDFYGDTDDVIQCHDGGLRFEVVFKKKRPAMDNFFTFPIISKNLRFSLQSFLTQKEIDEGIIRPLNVEDSYAVYHISKKNNQYMTGKAFHIYRPLAEDALGKKAWCSIRFDKYIEPTSLTITIPQQFLDEATYPITIDPDFGYSIIGGSWRSIAEGPKAANNEYRAGSAWEMPAPGGTANWLKAYVYGSNNACDVKAFINEKDSGGAGTHGQIATATNLACVIAAHWEEFTLGDEALTQAVDYILSVVGNKDDITAAHVYQVAYDENGAVDSYYEDHDYTTPESPWVVAAEGVTIDHSIYCNYTEAAGPTTYTRTWGIDAAFQRLGIEKARGYDAAFQLQGIEETFDIDALFVLRPELQRQLDAAFQAVGIERTPDVDTAFQLQGIEETPDFDTAFQRTVEETPDFDAIFKGLGIERTADIDTAFRLTIEETPDFDAAFQLQAIEETPDLDAAFQLQSIEKTPTIDAAFQLQGIEETPDFDAAFQLKGIEKTPDIDALFMLRLEKTPDFDTVFFRGDIPKTFGLDVLFFTFPPPVLVYLTSDEVEAGLTSDEVEAELTSDEVVVRVIV